VTLPATSLLPASVGAVGREWRAEFRTPIWAAGRHFNRGQRAFFFALGYLGWFVSPWVLFLTTAAVVIVTWRRQFASNAWQAMG